MRVRFDRLRCDVFQNLFLSLMNTGFVRPAIAIVLTACGIETIHEDECCTDVVKDCNSTYRCIETFYQCYSMTCCHINILQ